MLNGDEETNGVFKDFDGVIISLWMSVFAGNINGLIV